MKYIGYYDCEQNKGENRNYVLAATNKMTYIASVLARNGAPVEIISASGTLNTKPCPGKTLEIAPDIMLKLFPSMGTGGRIKRVLSRWRLHAHLFLYLMIHIRKGETVILYHSLGYMGLIRLIRAVKKFRLILEMEEIYGDVLGKKNVSERERKFAAQADGYIFPTVLLKEHLDIADKPYVLIHGTYQVEPQISDGFGDDKIHVVYAGTFDPRKGGAAAAVAAAEFLPENYHVHILGFGSSRDVANMKQVIKDVSGKTKATVTYDGLLSGEDYIRFIQSCQIGLSTQNPDADFNATSFPSKILSYMANGLRVVSIRIPAIETSAVGNDMYYYDKQTPEEIAKAIANIDLLDDYAGRDLILKLDKQFRQEIKEILTLE